MLVYPTLDDIGRALPHVDPSLIGHDMAYPAMLRFLPPGLMGLMIAGLLAAYVSTISTHLNWGTSYVVHDLYRRFLKPGETEKHYVLVGRLVTAALMVVAGLLTFVLQTAQTSFNLLLSVGAGTGLLYLLRWFWWRINAWSEIAAMASSFVVAVGFFIAGRQGLAIPAHVSLLVSVAITTVVWLAVTWLTPPTDQSVLVAFYRRVRPAGPGWAPDGRVAGRLAAADTLVAPLLASLFGCAAIYGALFAHRGVPVRAARHGDDLRRGVAGRRDWRRATAAARVGRARRCARSCGRTPMTDRAVVLARGLGTRMRAAGAGRAARRRAGGRGRRGDEGVHPDRPAVPRLHPQRACRRRRDAGCAS